MKVKKKKWWLGVREDGTIEIKYLVSAIRQPWVRAIYSDNIQDLLDIVEQEGIDPRSVEGLPPFVFGKRFSRR
jgi:hypothetical protein